MMIVSRATEWPCLNILGPFPANTFPFRDHNLHTTIAWVTMSNCFHFCINEVLFPRPKGMQIHVFSNLWAYMLTQSKKKRSKSVLGLNGCHAVGENINLETAFNFLSLGSDWPLINSIYSTLYFNSYLNTIVKLGALNIWRIAKNPDYVQTYWSENRVVEAGTCWLSKIIV